jgi:hypothetical protein
VYNRDHYDKGALLMDEELAGMLQTLLAGISFTVSFEV